MTLDVESAAARLNQFGISKEITSADTEAIVWCLDKVTAYICNECNVDAVPVGLIPAAVDRVCGEHLRQKKLFSPDEFADITADLGSAGAITVGDTSVTFKTAAEADNGVTDVDSFIRALLSEGDDQFSCFRKVRW